MASKAPGLNVSYRNGSQVYSWTYVWGDATSAAAGGRVWRLQFGEDLLQLARQLHVRAGAELRPEVFEPVNGNWFPGLNQIGIMTNTFLHAFMICLTWFFWLQGQVQHVRRSLLLTSSLTTESCSQPGATTCMFLLGFKMRHVIQTDKIRKNKKSESHRKP